MLRPYQQKAKQEIFHAWRQGDRSVMFQLVTGGGKTVLFVDIIKSFLTATPPRRVLLIAHREELITQAWNTLYKSGIFAGIIKADHKPNYALPCQVGSIQTLIRRKALPPADVVIIDEAHHSQDDNSYGNVLLEHYATARLLGVTATPYRLNGKGFTGMYQSLIMGPTFKELVNVGYLTPFRYFASSIPDLSKARMDKGDYMEEDAVKAMELAPIVESYVEHCEGLCGIVFAVNIEHSNKIVNQYIQAGFRAAHVDADTPKDERRNIFKKLANRELHIVSNVGIATEGTDIPNVDFVQLARPTKSLALFLQMVGRATRTIWEAIKDAQTDEERAAMVAASSKPYCYVLDNAGLWEEHGLPDQEFDWPRYFRGFEKKKKKDVDMIEIIEFVAEDETGRVVRSKVPKEVEGMKLIEVTRTVQERQKIINVTSLKEFDAEIAMLSRIKHVKKVGFVAFNNYRDYCRKKGILMSPEIWDYIIKKLCHEPRDKEASKLKDLQNRIDIARQSYPHNEAEADRLCRAASEYINGELQAIRRLMVPEGFLKKQRAEYIKANSIQTTVQ